MTDAGSDVPPQRTVGGFDRAGRVWVVALFGVGGVGAGVLLPLLAGWAADLPWVPFQGPLRLLSSFDQAWLVWGRPAFGLLAGLGFASWIILDSPVLDISRQEIRVRRRGQVERVIERAKVDAVHRRGSKVIIETAGGRTLFEDDVEGDRSAVRNAFVDNGYPWEGAPD